MNSIVKNELLKRLFEAKVNQSPDKKLQINLGYPELQFGNM